MSRALRYGVVGAGRVFQRFHLPCVLDRPDLRIVAVCDADPAQARATIGAGAAPDALYTTDLDEFLSAGRPDVVAVCTPNDAHRVPVLAAVAAGAAVLCEKPLAADLDDARQIAAGAGDALVGVNLPYRFHPLLAAFVAALDDGPCELELTFSTAGQRLWRPVTRWYGDAARAGGGALLDLGSHALDLLVVAFGWPEEVLGCRVDRAGVEERVGVEERAEARLRFARGPATVRIDRASRTMGLRVDARQGHRTVTLDLRRHEVRDGGKPIVSVEDPRIERAAVIRFLAAATATAATDTDTDTATDTDTDTSNGAAGQPADGAAARTEVVGTAHALRHQELIASLYAVAVPDLGAG